MLACAERWSLKKETMLLILGQPRSNYIGTRLAGGLALDETPVYIKLHLHVCGGRCGVYDPALDILHIGVINPTAKVGARRICFRDKAKRLADQL
jgi:hypothetical protein